MAEPFLSLFESFLDTYLADSGDRELRDVLPPFLAFRALVIAHPRWYPNEAESTRRVLLDFAMAMADGGRFGPDAARTLFGGAR